MNFFKIIDDKGWLIILLKKILLKAELAFTVLAVLLASALSNPSWAMRPEDDKDKRSYTVISGRDEILKRYVNKIIDDYQKCGPEVDQSATIYHYSLYFDLHRNVKSEWEFKPLMREYILFLDSEQYQEELFKDLKKESAGARPMYTLQTAEFFKFPPKKNISNLVVHILNKYTEPKELNLLKNDIFDSDFRVYKLLLMKDEGCDFNLLPKELRLLILKMSYSR